MPPSNGPAPTPARQVGDAHEQIVKAHRLLGETRRDSSIGRRGAKRAEATADELRAEARNERATPPRQALAIPIASPEIRPAARRIENALTVLHQLDYLVEVGDGPGVEANGPVDPDTVRNLARMAQLQLAGLTYEFSELPARFVNHDARPLPPPSTCRRPQAACRSTPSADRRRRRASTKPRSRDRSAGRGDRQAVRARGQPPAPEWITDTDN